MIALTILPGACSGSSSPADGPAHRTLDCSDPIDVLGEPPDGWPVVLDVIALPPDPVLQRGRIDDESGRSFSKFGLVIRAGRSFTMRLGEGSQPNALMGWNRSSDPLVGAIDVPGCSGTCPTDGQPGCPLGARDDWVVYPGGLWTVDPACVRIEIVTTDATATAMLPIGVACP